MNDLRFAFRQWSTKPGFTLIAALTLGLGVGANTAIFSVIHGVLLKPLPYPQSDRLVTLWERSPQRGIEQERVSGPNYLDWRAHSTAFAELAVSPGWEGINEFNLVLPDGMANVHASYVSASLFATLGTRPLLGRTLLPEEDRPEGNRAAVLSWGLWQRHFAGDSNVLGRTLTLDTYGRRDYTVVGVMPDGFGLPSHSELWLPIGWMGVRLDERRSAHWHHVLGRLKPGVTLAQARAEMNGIQARIKNAHPEAIVGSEVALVPLLEQTVGRNLRLALLVLWGVVGGVLLIACANLANLLLAQAAVRQREMAVRLALGASRWRVMRQLLVESLALALLGGSFGVLLAWGGLQVFLATSPSDLPRLAGVTLDVPVLGYTLVVSLLTGLLFGWLPAWQASRSNLGGTLNDCSRGISGGTLAGRARSLLIVAEVGVSLVLLIAAALMLQSFARMWRAERGFNPHHLVTAELDFSVSGFTTWVRPEATRPQVPLQELIERLRAAPGVLSVGAGSALLRRENVPPSQTFEVFGRPKLEPAERPVADFKGITPDWLAALGGRVLVGRGFTEADTLKAPGVALVNETLARRYFPNENPVGQYFAMESAAAPLGATDVHGLPLWNEIVGVVADVKSLHPQPGAVPEIYRPHWQWPMQNPTLLVRTLGEPATVVAAIRRETKAVIPSLPPPTIHTMDELLAQSVAQPRLQSGLLVLFGVLALVLAAVGLYGVVALSVGQRTRELGIRMALGAPRRSLLLLVLGQGMRLIGLGLAAGLLASLALTRVMRSLLYSITPTDPLTFTAVSFLLTAVALIACWLPARRAARLDPIAALRSEG